ncbi:MAG: SDR family NAD(P)-dependent oxidoreductase, partial [Halopseudomonas aestusnigri]
MMKRVEEIYRSVAAGQLTKAEAIAELREAELRAAELKTVELREHKASAANYSEIEEALVRLYGDCAKLSVESIDPQEPLEAYGIDSIIITEMNRRLSAHFSDLSKTLFFEHRTLGSLATYLHKNHSEGGVSLTGNRRTEDNASQTVKAINNKARQSKTKFEMAAVSERAAGPVPIAVIGLSGRYPMAKNIDEFWQNLSDGRDCISEIPTDRWSLDGFYEADPNLAVANGRSYGKWAGFVDGYADFDPLFFNISPIEATNMDPQERLFLMAAWHALEDAGLTRQTLLEQYEGNVGVYTGVTRNSFSLVGAEAARSGSPHFPQPAFSSIPNRVSYFLNLNGPSLPVDTMCSSSLTAVHEACAALQRGDCKLALAGGVNLVVHPSCFTGLSTARMLSTDGRCRSFGEGGDGYVPGEGVGIVLLKPLDAAIHDGDPIRGIIRATSVNHGGKTNGFTVPNPLAQADLVRANLRKAQVDARSVSYVEAHGTGTKLGDPIEVTGLTQAFADWTEDKTFCALGSAKSNIGHLEAAAGIAGLTKVLLQLRHGKLAPSLHAQNINPNINFEETPFVVQQSLDDWKRPNLTLNEERQEYSRVATVSSFGAGGSNAHVVVEEYTTPESVEEDTTAAIIVLSARTQEQLQASAKSLANFLGQSGDNEGLLEWSREVLADLVGVEVNKIDVDEPLEDLGVESFHRTQLMEQIQEILSIELILNDFLKKNSLREIIEELPGERSDLRLVDLAYTLQVGREAMDTRLGFVASSIGDVANILHIISKGQVPNNVWHGSAKKGRKALANQNDPFGTVTQALETGDFEALLELWVQGQAVAWAELSLGGLPKRVNLPGYPFAAIRCWPDVTPAQTEEKMHPMVHHDVPGGRASRFTGAEPFLTDHVVNGARVLPGVAYLEMARATTNASILRNVIWAKPIIVTEAGLDIRVDMVTEEGGKTRFEITSQDGSHCQGFSLKDVPEPLPAQDIKSMLARQTRAHFGANEIYSAYDQMGISYGPSHRGIEEIWAGEGELLAKLSLPAETEFGCYSLHPSLMDAAFQATLGLALGKAGGDSAMLPFALENLQIHSPIQSSMWAWIRETGNSGEVQKADIDLMDNTGKICVRMTGFSSRVVAQDKPDTGLLLCAPVWKDFVAVDGDLPERRVFMLGFNPKMEGTVSLQTSESDRGLACCDLYEQLFTSLKSLLESKLKQPVLVQVVVQDLLLCGISGMLRSAVQESRYLLGQIMVANGDENISTLQTRLDENAASPQDMEIRYVEGVRQIRLLEETTQLNAKIPWKDDGVYLLTGGAGDLGLLFATEIASRTTGATLILTGRSVLQAEREQRIADIDAQVSYQKVDVTNADAVNELVQQILEDYGKLDGVLHIAGVLRDSYAVKKDTADFRQVLAPKIKGAVNLDLATRDLDLDLFVTFSSGAAVFGNLGQTDYAAANSFLDTFARYRGKGTLSVNWPLWAEGSMGMNTSSRDMMLTTTGMMAMATKSGFDALYRSLASKLPQVVVAEGLLTRMREKLLAQPKVVSSEKVPPSALVSNMDSTALMLATEKCMRGIVSELLQLDVEQIDVEDNLGDYGFDSITFTNFSNQINKTFKLELIPTVFFDYPEITSIASHLTEDFPEALRAALNLNIPDSAPTQASEQSTTRKTAKTTTRTTTDTIPVSQPYKKRGVAIVGLAGRFPGARDIDAFWELLQAGTDAVSEVPANRWDWRDSLEDGDVSDFRDRVKWGAFIDGADEFDPLFFGISPREAELMDPQQRLMMMYVWAALEDAGYAPSSLAGSDTGLYMATAVGGYGGLIMRAGLGQDAYSSTSSVASIGPNRLSYFLDLHGPSEPIETACSSSLIALHRGVQAISSGTCEMVVAGGVNVMTTPEAHVAFAKAGMLSVDGRCKTFSAQANGYVRGEGCAMLVLKDLETAERDGDTIHGVILASAENHGGRATSLTAPNPKAQATLLKKAYLQAGIDPRTVGYIEAHGTGTELGDPIEINALKAAFKELHGENPIEGHCSIGSVKTNIGHLELAAGVAGVVKTLLQMRHRTLVKSLHCDEVNPYLQLDGSPFRLVHENKVWNAPFDDNGEELPRRAGVSSFGFGGVNAHVVLEEYRSLPETEVVKPQVFILSAKTEARLRDAAKGLSDFAESHSEDEAVSLSAIAYTLQTGRDAMDVRLGFVAGSKSELVDTLRAWIVGADSTVQMSKGKSAGLDLFTGDEDMEAVIESWWEKGKQEKLLGLWVQGLNLDWARLYSAGHPRRISLPTYPFARDSYWVPIVDAEPLPLVSKMNGTTSSTSDILFFKENWQAASLNLTDVTARTLVCCLTDTGHQNALRQVLAIQKPDIQIFFLARTGENSTDTFVVEEETTEAWSRALAKVHKLAGNIDALAYFWPIEDVDCRVGALTAACLLQAVAKSDIHPQSIILGGAFTTNLERDYQESWIGFARSLGLSLPGCEISTIAREDHGLPDWKIWGERLLQLLGSTGVSLIETDGELLEPKIVASQIPANGSLVELGQTVLITGGLGGLGLIMAKHLAQKTQPNLILTGRSALDDAKRLSIEMLKEVGSKVFYLQADVADADAMIRGVNEARTLFGPIEGVLHVAGLMDVEMLADKNMGNFANVLKPKIVGTQVLEEILSEDPVKTTVLFSSSSAILGDFGSCDYAIANRYLLAQARRKGTKVIMWPLWRAGGMGAGDGDQAEFYLKSSGQRILETDEGLALFERLLVADGSHMVLAGDKDRIATFLNMDKPEESSAVEVTLEDEITALVATQVKMTPEDLDAEANLADFGLDSIGLAALAQSFGQTWGIKVAPSVFFTYSSIERLANFLRDKHSDALIQRSEKLTLPSRAVTDPVSKVRPVSTQVPLSEPVPEHPTLEQSTSEITSPKDDPIAIIGMSGRFPGARDVDEMWRILEQGIDAVDEVPGDHFDWREIYGGPEAGEGPSVSKWGGCLSGIREFDPLFFEISPREAISIDPRQRLLLQESWKALEDAGQGPGLLGKNRVGVFVGVEEGDYARVAPGLGITSNHNGILASRLSYFLDLDGPAIAVNTACSSGLVAVHQACISLKAGDCEIALAAAANLILTPEPYVGMSQAGMLSPDGKCHAFGKDANGMVPGEAVVVVVLKPLSKALADGDPIRALIAGSGINNDGRSNGITAPNALAQTKLLREVWDKAGIDPKAIGHLVSHGTGTRLGDPVEADALTEAFGHVTGVDCALTSTKSNFGHTFAASGLVSLIGLVKGIERATIPASLHCEEESDYVDWASSPFRINKKTQPWSTGSAQTRIGGVSSFGMSGTNAHLLVQGYDGIETTKNQGPVLLALSAKTEEALVKGIKNLRRALSKPVKLTAVSRTLTEGRHAFEHRCALVVEDTEQALRELESVQRVKVSRGFKGNGAGQERLDVLLRPNADRSALNEIASLYLEGYEVQWERMFGPNAPARVSLPTYSFSRDEYWPADISKSIASKAVSITDVVPPSASSSSLLDIDGFIVLTGDEFYLRDHVVGGAKILPGVMYLELVRQAAARVMPGPLKLERITWLRPLVVAGPVELNVSLEALGEDRWRYEVLVDGQLHGQGDVCPGVVEPVSVRKLRLDGARQSGAECYAIYSSIGVEYGPSFRVIEELSSGPDGVVARLRLGSVAGDDGLELHPSLLDGALQASLGLATGDEGLSLPFGLESLEIHRALPRDPWVVVKNAGN